MSLQVCDCGWSKVTTYHGLRTHQGKMGCTWSGGGRLNTSDMSLQVCDCGWSKVTTYHGLRTHQGMMGCTPKGLNIPKGEQFRYNFTPLKSEDQLFTLESPGKESPQKNNGPISWSFPVRKEMSPIFSQEVPAVETKRSFQDTQQHFLQTAPNWDTNYPAIDFAGFAQPLQMSQIFITQVKPAEVTATDTTGSAFETPPRYSTAHLTTGNARRALDFYPGAEQVGQQLWDLPTTTAQETAAVQLQESRKEKAWRDRIRADLQQKIQTRKETIAGVRSSEKACKCGLDAEWLEINSVFSEVMRVVEDARQKALQPLEDRRRRVKRDAQDLVQTLQKEIDELKKSIDELDKNPDLQVSPPMGLDDTCDVTIDTSFSFGSLRTTTSNMMRQLHQKLEKLSPVELKRMPAFAVDVKLDPTTAHPYLVLSPDGKKVSDGGKNQKVPDAPQRFDMFGSVVGRNRLTSGKSYWEVEVTNKTGWDLGVARHGLNHKGKLSLNPRNGYWVTVHYEGESYAAMTAPPVSLPLTRKPQKVGVFVDYDEGLVSFYDVTAQSHIYSFSECLFRGEILPYFSPHLKQNDKNSHPLIISAVNKQRW